MKVKDLKLMINKLSEDADIKICVNMINLQGNYRGILKEIDDISTVIDQDTNKGRFVINTVEERMIK